jgi:hypothetical protein
MGLVEGKDKLAIALQNPVVYESQGPSRATKQRNALREQEIPSSSTPVIVSDQARTLISASTQAQRLPSALAWKFDALKTDIKEIVIGTVENGETILIDILHSDKTKNYQYAIEASRLKPVSFEALGFAACVQGIYKEQALKVRDYVVHDGLVFCDKSGRIDICEHIGCKRAQVLVGNYEPVPARACRTSIPFTGKLSKNIIHRTAYSNGQGGVLIWGQQEWIETVNAKDLGIILAVNTKKVEVEIFVNE